MENISKWLVFQCGLLLLECPHMRTIQAIYDEYRIMPTLQLHQLRVAAVGKLICEHSRRPAKTEAVVTTCLLHDMANILKSDLATFPAFLEPQGIAYWQQVKDDFRRRYGADEKEAASAIAREIGAPAYVVTYLDSIGFSLFEAVRESDSLEIKICEYADCRVGPYGVLSLDDRLYEAKARYRNTFEGIEGSEERFRELLEAAHDVERQIFADNALAPAEITDEAIAPIMETLRKYPIAC